MLSICIILEKLAYAKTRERLCSNTRSCTKSEYARNSTCFSAYCCTTVCAYYHSTVQQRRCSPLPYATPAAWRYKRAERLRLAEICQSPNIISIFRWRKIYYTKQNEYGSKCNNFKIWLLYFLLHLYIIIFISLFLKVTWVVREWKNWRSHKAYWSGCERERERFGMHFKCSKKLIS